MMTEILEACKRGDRLAQKAFYEHFKDRMFVMCLRYANNRQDAEDILQEGFITVFRDLYQYTGSGNLEGWVRKVILRVALQYVRKQKQQLKWVDSQPFPEYEDDDPAQLEEELVKKILHQMHQMPVGFRTVLNLYIMEGYSHQQIASELGISVGTSKSQLNRAKQFLKDLVNKTLLG